MILLVNHRNIGLKQSGDTMNTTELKIKIFKLYSMISEMTSLRERLNQFRGNSSIDCIII